MSQFIPESFSEEFASNVEMLLQQKPSRFREAVRSDSYTGRGAEVVQQLGAFELVDESNRHGDTDILDVPHSVRWVHPKDKGGAVLLDKNDDIRTLASFESPYAESGRMAANRVIDDQIINAAFSNTSITGVDQDVIQSWDTFTAANTDHKIAAGGVGLNAAKIKSGLKALRKAEVDLQMERVYCAVTAEEIEDLQLEDQYINWDYTDQRTLQGTAVKPFLGVNFIHSERLLLDGSSNTRCPMWAQSGLALGLWQDINVDIGPRRDKRNATQVYISLTVGATRVEEKKIVEILCA